MGADLFFPAGERDDAAVARTAAAKQVCAACEVRLHCLTYALVASVDDGIWGGLDPAERRILRRARRARRRARRASEPSGECWPVPTAGHAAGTAMR
jgi:WhiB family redox-sensing transcriptional regulator